MLNLIHQSILCRDKYKQSVVNDGDHLQISKDNEIFAKAYNQRERKNLFD